MGSGMSSEAEIQCRPLIARETLDFGESSEVEFEAVRPFSWRAYLSFFTIGLSMMWTWSMILQAIPYFQQRFLEDSWVLRNFQAFYLVFFAFTMLVVTFVISMQSEHPSYSGRLRKSLVTYLVVAILLVLSTLDTFKLSARPYLVFTLAMVVITSIANSMSQNAAFAFTASFGRTEYAPAIMTGEAVAGLLPSTIEIISALAFPVSHVETDSPKHRRSSSTTVYFFTAAAVALASLASLEYLQTKAPRFVRNEKCKTNARHWEMARKLKWPALANFSCLCISSVTPIFAAKITSLEPETGAPVLLQPHAFIPLAIILWNVGDLMGSILAVASKVLIRHPHIIFALSIARLGFIPLYLNCNIDGRGSFAGDWFYLVVQIFFGMTHGWLSGTSMMGVPEWVEPADREDAGAFMGMTLVSGLVAGSVLGLVAAQV
ncbi:hypothetical protein IFR05_002684 [Cadophora sp. M221]|nr:hypothetical protein IFR05_002684 [Cadophora sp. M221]